MSDNLYVSGKHGGPPIEIEVTHRHIIEDRREGQPPEDEYPDRPSVVERLREMAAEAEHQRKQSGDPHSTRYALALGTRDALNAAADIVEGLF